MKKVKFIGYAIFIMLLGFAISSCKGDDGSAGEDGIDGTDGNANVTIIKLMETDMAWTLGTYITFSSNFFSYDTSAINQDIIDHGTVLGYAYLNTNLWLPLPWNYSTGPDDLNLAYSYMLNNVTLYAYASTGPWPANAMFSEYRFMLIVDNTVGKSASKDTILEELKNAGINANNYFEVCEYYGINP